MTIHRHPDTPPVPGYHPVTRWLHAALVLGVLFQLACTLLMAHPEHQEPAGMIAANTQLVLPDSASMPPAHQKDALGDWLMAAHRTGGIFVALIVLANLLWAVMPRGNPKKRQLAVLFSASHWAASIAIAQQLPLMLMGKKPLPEPGNALSLVFEMFGLLTMTAMAVTGSIIWNMWAGPGNTVSEAADFWMETHAGIAVLLFVYLAGHVAMALLHRRSGDAVFERILPWGSRS